MISFRVCALLFALTAALPASAADQARAVPDTPATFALTGDQRWVVLLERQDGEAAIGLARDQVGEHPNVQVARTRDGKYAVLVGPQAEMSAEQLKEKFSEGRGVKEVRQSRGEEFVARAWHNSETRLATAEMQEGKPLTVTTGALALTLRVQRVKKKKDDTDHIVVAEGREDGKTVFTVRSSDALYTPQPAAKASWVQLEGGVPQAVFSVYTGGAHCCMANTIVTKTAGGKWKVIPAGKLDGDYGPAFEDLDGDGSQEILSVDNAFLYQFDSYADSWPPAKIEKLIGGALVDVTRRPEYRRYHQQFLAAMEARAEDESWTRSGFLAGWVAQKILLGEGAEAYARAQKSHDPGTGAPFEECTINRPVEKCPAKNKRTVTFVEVLRTFLDKNGYR
jgi:serine protease Do